MGVFSPRFQLSYLGVRKPVARIYEIALDVMHGTATSLFVEIERKRRSSARLGIHALHVTDPGVLSEHCSVRASTLRAAGRSNQAPFSVTQ